MNPPTAAAPQDRTSPLLAVTGFLMLLAPVLAANPYSGQQPMWPWQLFELGMASAYAQTEILLWALTGLWVLVMAFTPARGLRATVATALALVLLLHTSRGDSGIPIKRFYLNDMVPLIGFSTGLLLLWRHGPSRGARLLCGAGGLLFFWAFLVGFTGEATTPRYVLLFDDLRACFTGGSFSETRYAYGWYYVLPQLVLFGAALLALLAALGLTGRRFVLVALLVLVAGMIAPIPVRVAGTLFGEDPEATRVGGSLFMGLAWDGVLVWLFTSASLADFLRADEGAA